MGVAIGNNDVTEDISENDPIPSRRLFEPYASSKLSGEHIVLAANSKCHRNHNGFRSVSLGNSSVLHVSTKYELFKRHISNTT